MIKAACAAAILIVAFISFVLAQTAGSSSQQGTLMTIVSPDVLKDLAPTGKLRAAINLGNMVLAQKDPATGQPKGITPDLARELGRRLGVPVELVPFDAAGKVFEAVKTGALDVMFLAIEPVRANEIAFTAPYVLIEGVYMVPKDSKIASVADVDRDGIRVGVSKNSAYDLYLTRTLKHATLVRGDNGIALFVKDKLDAAGGVKQPLVAYAKTNPNVRILDGRFMEIRQAMGTPKGRGDAGARYLGAFIEEMKASGFVADALKRSNQPDAAVAPPAS
ncbi:MAG TPA: ABC transporter substrate-binding protein [Xanthobacteraceae bacterium]|jgi:polar amino acid transport system substrate-binding protein|nr:ABC transporter substrate-binding protein [Xanthobacteraceae bacterium]